MPLIREFREEQGVWVFDPYLEQQEEVYSAGHLEVLERVEQGHFWFENRKRYLCTIFQRYIPRTARILEIGGGTGFIAAALQGKGFSVEMADLHRQALLYAKEKGINRLYQFDLLRPPFQAEFDAICLFDVLEHLPNPLQALGCIKQMLKPGGLVLLTVPAHQWLWSREDTIAGHQRRFCKRALKKLLINAQLDSLELRYFFVGILPFLLLRRWMKRDDRSPVAPEERFQPEVSPHFNCLFDHITRAEFALGRALPNLCGGSLLGVAQYKTL